MVGWIEERKRLKNLLKYFRHELVVTEIRGVTNDELLRKGQIICIL